MQLPQCFVYQLTGLHCPGCGATRAVSSLINGDWFSAFTYNWLFLPSVAVLAFLGGWVLLAATGRVRSPWNNRSMETLMMGIGFALLAFGVLRNIPGLEFLAPHAA